MRLKKVIAVEDAVAIIRDGDVVASTGYGGNGTPDELFIALEQRFLQTGAPRDLTLVFAGGQGDSEDKGLNHLGHEGLVRRVIGGHFGLTPRIERLIVENRIEAYNLPEGVLTHLYRDIAAGKPGTLSRVGLGTFVDPRHGGGRMNERTTEELVRVIEVDGQEFLLFRAFPINVALIRGTTADPDGNVTSERESLTLENLALATAAKNSQGVALCQVERIAGEGTLDPRHVRIPGILVDCVVLARPEHHMQTYGTHYNPAFSGEVRIPLKTLPPLPLDERKVIARRAALELAANSIINVGIGMPDNVARIAGEEKIQDLITLTVDPGVIGGVPMGGLDFGAAVNFRALIDHCAAFDFIDGGGLDAAFLGFGECDARGNVNASRFGARAPGCGGFINISQNSKKVVFMGAFTSGGLKTAIGAGRIAIEQEGKHRKFVPAVGQVTFSGEQAAARGQPVVYVTERCVFRLEGGELVLAEVAPGIDIERDILRLLPFAPRVDTPVPMDASIFEPGPMRLRGRMLDIHIDDRLSYDAESNTVFMNYAGMRVRTEEDIRLILDAVDRLLAPLGKRVNSIVNYDRFVVDDDATDAYMDAVRYVEEKYYLKVTRYTNSGFMRLKLGKELENRRLSSRVFETAEEARRSLAARG
jgi:propionate CoA-transferase